MTIENKKLTDSELDDASPPLPDGFADAGRDLAACQAKATRDNRLIATIEARQVESIPLPIAYLDLDFTIIVVNTTFTRTFGLTREELLGRNYFLLFSDVETEAGFRRVVQTCQAECVSDRPMSLASQPERGVTFWEWVLAPVKSSSNIVEGLICCAIETTQRVRAAEVQQKVSEDLETTVRQRTSALQRVNLEMAAEVQRRTVAETELRSLSRRLVQLQEDERRRTSHELHDEVGQNLTMLKMILDTAARRPAALTPDTVKNASEQVSRIIAQVRSISMSLHPSALEVLGLEPALRAFFDRLRAQSGLSVDFHSEIDNERLDSETRLCIYRVIQEALTNVMRYSGVKQASVSLVNINSHLALSITDDGRGFDYNSLSTGQANGISGMRERVFTVGGSFRLQTGIGKGTSIDIELPYHAPPENP